MPQAQLGFIEMDSTGGTLAETGQKEKGPAAANPSHERSFVLVRTDVAVFSFGVENP
jgi:hypothetical protein